MAKVALGLLAVFALGVLTIGSIPWISQAAEEVCCEAGDTTPPDELVRKIPPWESQQGLLRRHQSTSARGGSAKSAFGPQADSAA